MRDKAILLTMFCHGLRASELIALEQTGADFKSGQLHVHRLKGGREAVHTMRPEVMRTLKRYLKERP